MNHAVIRQVYCFGLSWAGCTHCIFYFLFSSFSPILPYSQLLKHSRTFFRRKEKEKPTEIEKQNGDEKQHEKENKTGQQHQEKKTERQEKKQIIETMDKEDLKKLMQKKKERKVEMRESIAAKRQQQGVNRMFPSHYIIMRFILGLKSC